MNWKYQFILLHFLNNYAHTTTCYEIIGNLTLWDSIFASRKPNIILDSLSNGLSWTEGPVLFSDEKDLIFSDTIQNNIYSFNLETKELQILFESSGDADPAELIWRAEPGSNGLATIILGEGGSDEDQRLIVCQHGGRRLSLFNCNNGERYPLVETYSDSNMKKKRFNGLNDVTVNKEVDGTYVYFTDPVYAWLEKERFDDLPYLDEHVQMKGPGVCGVYRSLLTIDGNGHLHGGKPKRIAVMDRPNGIGFLKGQYTNDILVVSDSCQGRHKETCQQGTSRWKLFRSLEDDIWEEIQVIEDKVDASTSTSGAADGFKTILGPDGGDMLIASCSGGLCLVDIQNGQVVARIWTAAIKNDKLCKISNVAVATNSVFLTGNCGIMQLPLQVEKSQYVYAQNDEL